MSETRVRRVRTKHVRSYRKVRVFLWAFGTAGLALGLGLMAWFGLHRHWHLAGVGLVYLLVALILFGIRGVLGHLDEERRRRRDFRKQSLRAS